MSRTAPRSVPWCVFLTVGLVTLGGGVSAQQPSTANGEWTHYTGDVRGARYSPLDQIDAGNFEDLEVAWTFKTDNFGPQPENKLEGTPLMVGGVLYTTAGTRRAVIALDATTGELLWSYRLDEGARADAAPRQLSGRGLSYWTDGQGNERIFYVTIGYRLVSLDAKTGRPIPDFGIDGMVDLKMGAVVGRNGRQEQIDLVTGEIGLHSTPTVTGDKVIVGSAMLSGRSNKHKTNTKGLVRAFDARTGEQLWRFDPMPGPGEFGHETWEDGSWEYTGNVGVWTQITVDEEAGLVYLPVESPTNDFYGGNRPGDNLFAESLVAVDRDTGEYVWHYQTVHHPIWDHDLSSWAILADINVDGREIKALAMPSKQSRLYVFDRITGAPVWPIVETPVPQSDVPGEKTSPTQPIPSRPAPYARAFLVEEDLIDFTPEMRQQALANLERYRWEESPYVPPILGSVEGLMGAINVGNVDGGTIWAGGSLDPETQIVYVQAANDKVDATSINPVPPEEGDAAYNGDAADNLGVAGPEGSSGGNGLEVQELPIVKPPYGVISAIDLNTGEILWQVPHGDTPDYIRYSPALEGIEVPKTGQGESVGVMVTKTLVVSGDPEVTDPPWRPRGAMMRAYDKTTGDQVGEVWMPAQVSGSPMTYMVDGKQYIVIAVSGGPYSGEYIAYTLPDES